jgi:hypothetical protein
MKIPTHVNTGLTSRKRLLAFGLLLCGALHAVTVEAEEPERTLLNDVKLYVSAPLRWESGDWMKFAGTVFAIGISHEFDVTVRNAFDPDGNQPLDGGDPNGTRDALPAVALLAGTWVFGAFSHDKAGRHEAWNMAEAAGFSAVDSLLLKTISGRRRPNETTSPDEWFQSGDSFPSMHASAAFAIGTVFAESGSDEHRWWRRTLGYGLAGATAYARVHSNVHWFSDVFAGAAIGIATAHFVMDRDAEVTRRSGFSVVPLDGGVMLTYRREP